MYLYNVSVIIEESIHEELIIWIKDHIVDSQKFNVHFLEMLHSPHEGLTYCLQVVLPSEEGIQDFQEVHLAPLQNHITASYKDKAFLFASTMRYLKK